MDGEDGEAALLPSFQKLQICEQESTVGTKEISRKSEEEGCGICAICLDSILLRERAIVKGCEHAYCVSCILTWASYRESPWCPQCKHPFTCLNLHRSLDGCIHDHSFEESIFLLLRAPWFVPLSVDVPVSFSGDSYEELQFLQDYDDYYDEDLEEALYNLRATSGTHVGNNDDFGEAMYNLRSGSGVRIGNRRWGDNGYVKAGRMEARPRPPAGDAGAGPSSREPNKSDLPQDPLGRRAKRALKREAADKAAAAKHQKHLQRLGRE